MIIAKFLSILFVIKRKNNSLKTLKIEEMLFTFFYFFFYFYFLFIYFFIFYLFIILYHLLLFKLLFTKMYFSIFKFLPEFWPMKNLVGTFGKKLEYCCPEELEPLMQLPYVQVVSQLRSLSF